MTPPASNTPSVPYYRDAFVTLYHGDAMEVLPRLGLGQFDLFTDPPYGELGYDWDVRPDWRGMPLPNLGWAVIFGHQPHLSKEVLPALEERGLPFRFEWVWEKPIGRLWNHERPIRLHELAWCFGNIRGTDLRTGFGGQHPSVIAAPTFQAYMRKHPEATGHPTQKPLVLVQSILSSLPGTHVLDPFAGTGATLIAAKALGRYAIGVELQEEYCEIAAQRFAQDVLPLTFADAPYTAALAATTEDEAMELLRETA